MGGGGGQGSGEDGKQDPQGGGKWQKKGRITQHCVTFHVETAQRQVGVNKKGQQAVSLDPLPSGQGVQAILLPARLFICLTLCLSL